MPKDKLIIQSRSNYWINCVGCFFAGIGFFAVAAGFVFWKWWI